MMRFPFFHMGFGWLLMGLFPIGAILLLGWLVWAVVRRAPANPMSAAESANARQILDERYARGEITREEYERIKSDLAAR